VRFEDHRQRQLTHADRSVFAERWQARVGASIVAPARGTHPGQAVIQLGYAGVQVQVGRGIVSLGLTDGHEPPELSVDELVDEAATMLGLVLCNGANADMSLENANQAVKHAAASARAAGRRRSVRNADIVSYLPVGPGTAYRTLIISNTESVVRGPSVHQHLALTGSEMSAIVVSA
jgi:hypothetical protein